MAILTSMVFLGALATAMGMIAMSIVPQWRRIASLASGRVELPPFAATLTPTTEQRRVAVRRSAVTPAPVVRLRAAA